MKGFSGDTQSVSLLVSKQEKGVRQLRKYINYEFYGSVDGGRWDSMIALDHLDLGPHHGYPGPDEILVLRTKLIIDSY